MAEPRLIDANALDERFDKRIKWLRLDMHDQYSLGLYHGAITDKDLISEMPTVDAVPVVRCCECKFGVTPYGGWISVDDRLPIEEAKAHEQEWPGEYCEFLVMIEKGSLPTTLYYDLEENEWFRINTALERETYEVTHWMPLPEPPKGE